ncbi:MAG: tripartite tricarboxylate transporter TctB family protein [Pseudomonadota bacterium]
MKYSEVILLVGLAIFAGVLLKDSFSLSYASDGGFGPGFIPRNFAVATILLAGLLIYQAYREHRGEHRGELRRELRRTATAEPAGDAGASPALRQLVPPAVTILLLFGATYLMEFGSVLAPLGVTITIVSAVFLNHSWVKAAALSVATLAVIYAIFSLWLNIPVL